MPVTVDTFEPQHFDALLRGLTVAHEAFARLQNDLHDEREERKQAEIRIDSLEDELASAPSDEEWERLIEFIEDVERGSRSIEELFDYVRRDK